MVFFGRICCYFCRVSQRYRIKYGFKIMVAIRPFASDTQAQVDLTIREKDQLILAGFFSAVDLVADSYGSKVLFLFQHFIEQVVKLFH